MKNFHEIEEIFRRNGLNMKTKLPEIVVVGGQSAGKSTILESLIGYQILPKGMGIQTRCPVRVRLQPIAEKIEYAVCHSKPGQRFTIKQISELIDERNTEIATTKYIDDKALEIDIYANNVLNITLVDTPGLCNIRLDDQPEDIVETLLAMAKRYASNENSIILAITPANIDLAMSDALKIAKLVDPNLQRTLGVLTKIDLMNPNNNCIDVMHNKQFKIAKGFIGVKCAATNDRNMDITDFAEIFRIEEQYFKNHEIYSKNLEFFGIRSLKDRLSRVFKESIEASIPGLQAEIRSRLIDVKQNLVFYHDLAEKSKTKKTLKNQVALANLIVQRANTELLKVIDGSSVNFDVEDEFGGFYLREELDLFQKKMSGLKDIDIDEDTLNKIWDFTNGLEELDTLRSSLIKIFMNDFFEAIKSCIMECLEGINRELIGIIENLHIKEFDQYANMRYFFIKNLKKQSEKSLKKTRVQLLFLVKQEKIQQNPDDLTVLIKAVTNKDKAAAMDTLMKFYELSRHSLDKNVPKCIKYHFIHKTCKGAYHHMLNELVTNTEFLLKQDNIRVETYKKLLTEKNNYKEVLEKLEIMIQRM